MWAEAPDAGWSVWQAMMKRRTQIGIIGSGPAGLVLSHLLALEGIESIILDRQSRSHIEGRIRAGVLEQGTVDAIRRIHVNGTMDRDGLVHDGFTMMFDGDRHRIDLLGLAGASVMAYGQTELTRDLIAARLANGGEIVFGADNVQPVNVASDQPSITYSLDGEPAEIDCDYIAGCDGFHGVSRQSIPSDVLKTFERTYPFGWLGLLSDTPPISEELIYVHSERGFALCSMRSKTRSRYYLQSSLDDDPEAWSDGAFWDELALRLGPDLSKDLVTGPSLEKSIAPLRSFVCEPMRHGRLFLAGDAAHIVPPTGAKGLNLAIADVQVLAKALTAAYRSNDRSGLDHYSKTCLERIWKVERFSWYMSTVLHHFPDASPFEQRMQRAEFDCIRDSETASKAIAENYVGLPLDL